MTKEKKQSLEKYAQDLKNRLSSAVPAKHVGHPDTFKRFLTNELKTVTAVLEQEKLDATGGK